MCMLEYQDWMDRYVPAPVGEHEPEELSSWTLKKPIRPENSRDKGTSHINTWLKHADNDDNRREAEPEGQYGYQVVVTANKVDPLDETRQRCDMALYPTFSAPTDREEGANWAAIEEAEDSKFEPTSERRKDNLGQIMSYATLLYTKQHRAHLFTVVLFGDMARLIRWDHSGIVVTKKFNYHQEPIKLGRFLWRLCHLSAAQRGHDPTVTRVLSTSAEDELIEKRAEKPILEGVHEIGRHARLLFKESITNKLERYKIRVDGRDFLVGGPHFASSELAGRGTRCYVAIDCDNPEGPFVYLKDAWRVAHEGIEREGDVLAYLNDDGIGAGRVEGVPTLVCHGDVEDQQTDSQEVWKALHPDEPDCPLKTHRHYRIVVEEVGLPMGCFRNAAELVASSAFAFKAYKKGVNHRDVSAGNVLIYIRESIVDGQLVQERVGLLTDWEVSKRTDILDTAQQSDRTGTWQFMSAYTLSNPDQPASIPDEIEAFFHVLLFFAIRYLRHNYEDVGEFMSSYFNGYLKHRGDYYCGQMKYDAMHQGAISVPGSGSLTFSLPAGFVPPPTTRDLPPSETHILNDLIASLLRLFSARYTLHQLAKSPSPTGHNLPPPPTRTAALPSGQFARMREQMKGLYRPTAAGVARVKHAQADITPKKRAQLMGVAAQLESHEEIVTLYASFFLEEQELQWPPQDTVPDQLPKNYRPKNNTHHEGHATSRPATGSKRATMEDEAGREYPDTKRQLRSSRNPVD
ncbi:hypothetical protein L226DRAFT_525028 [Lentinus tigrinus ALCF2SS1-7]|uniref:Fungal-type protein kinase domain-containing protein n=1 Tax=Lentinus tigrinus ALCF2SS1-6 TaxID=1328759 RepID=A0A5C2S8T1_9APHY|nr:hypothetical protein L227DRAFT_602329 [Lentinus tigrinus ALCF2SS1-6]RPD71888.1 hypothetical protein L226DRAFT_525028 [Lentinus tigrinus ALCF2SS1-7]